jgi:hypothetical protein
MTISAKIRRYLANGASPEYIAKKLGISKNRVYTVRWKDANKTVKPKKAKPTELKREAVLTNDEIIALFDHPKPDLVNHPPHYKAGGIEVIDFIEAKDLNFRLGNAVKYISRAGKKGDPIEDLEKALWYLQREIAARRKGA